ncbi:hypothetical protein H312_02407, partial [Anncaliia algerae PRA339]
DYNKIYDSFIKWQFSKLKGLGLLSFGKRYTVYCTKTEQPCLDHDRLQGEGILPKEVDLLRIPIKIKEGTVSFLVPYALKKETTLFKLYYNPKNKLVLIMKEDTFIMEEEVYMNLKYQVNEIKFIREVNWDEINLIKEEREFTLATFSEENEKDLENSNKFLDVSTLTDEVVLLNEITNNKTFLSLNLTNHLLRYYKTDGEVISRSNTKCVVALMDQWFIDYNNADWKTKAFACIDNMITNKETKQFLKDGMAWIGKWAFSRSFGIGTSFDKYVIDSLSDSTIYMTLYSFYHLLSNDLFGNENMEPWMFDYIFQDLLHENIKKNLHIFCTCNTILETNGRKRNGINGCIKCTLDKCRTLLNSTYPVYLRVSGKDLIRNHLLFYILNHVALFKQQYWPRRIETNGHLLLNSAKMSKSTGNFLTIDEVLAKYGESGTKMCLAMCGDTNEDADFLEVNANSSVLKIYQFIELVKEYFSKNMEVHNGTIDENLCTLEEKWLMENIHKNIYHSDIAYKNFTFRDVIKYGFHEMLNSYEKYLTLGGKSSSHVIYLLFKSMTIILYPIIPSVSVYLNDNFFKCNMQWPATTLTNKYIPAFEYVKKIQKKIQKLRSKKNLTIIVGKESKPWKNEIIEIVNNLKETKNWNINLLDRVEIQAKSVPENIKDIFLKILTKHNVDQKIGMPFCVKVYLTGADDFDEMDVLLKNKNSLEKVLGYEINIIYGEAEPYEPILKID